MGHILKVISVVIPAYNESEGILETLQDIENVLQGAFDEFEIIVVDDGSQDNTAETVKEQARVKLIQHPTNKGYGAALKTGIRRATHPIICITDADSTYPSRYIPQLHDIFHTKQQDMIVGARTGENVAIPLIRRPAKWFLRKLASYVASEPIPDLNSGLRLFRRDTVMRFFNLLPDGFSFTTTITLAMLTNNYLVEYVSIDYSPRKGRSKIKPIQDTLNFLQLVTKIALYFRPLKVFLPLSLLLFIASLGVGFSTFLAGRVADVSTLLLFTSAVQIGGIGLLAEMMNARIPSQYTEKDI